MYIPTSTEESLNSIVRLLVLLAQDTRLHVGEGLVGLGRPQPSVPGEQLAHVKIAYDRGHSPFGDDQRFVVHSAVLDAEGRITFIGGVYDLTLNEALQQLKEK